MRHGTGHNAVRLFVSANEPAGAGYGAPISARVDYFPVHNNARLVYQGENNEFASYGSTDFARDNRQQKRIVTGGADAVRVSRYRKPGAVVFSQGGLRGGRTC